ncbi:pyridoxamine 5'-phosphate oxidase family protein [Paenalkalicoccus suaedae]|uniref:Pyridoxamine 5'-phosphate oxidase family protein n=1 Tax=Paenalkalicoccus suaedae TaxID=2592382 RepID=A0A859FF20_9BACI|nr:pyridoxamine 5'-phosphate oxidase family protein [Paenalkalicoccus suaedae]QKS71561.1 pyridoxamine 5'-phosphate oxidase family protein [Paenalkalicoccus suaedae]
MANRVENMLTEELVASLQEERYVTIATVDHETGGPNVNAISWIYAINEQTVRFAVDSKSRILTNIREQPLVTVTVIADGSTFSMSGRAKVMKDSMENVSLRLGMVELTVSEVRDVMFYGARLTSEPKFEKTYDLEAAEKLDKQVMHALKQ